MTDFLPAKVALVDSICGFTGYRRDACARTQDARLALDLKHHAILLASSRSFAFLLTSAAYSSHVRVRGKEPFRRERAIFCMCDTQCIPTLDRYGHA